MVFYAPTEQICDFWTLFLVTMFSEQSTTEDLRNLRSFGVTNVINCSEFPYTYIESITPIQQPYPHYCILQDPELSSPSTCVRMLDNVNLNYTISSRTINRKMMDRLERIFNYRSICHERTMLYFLTNIPCDLMEDYPDLRDFVKEYKQLVLKLIERGIHARIFWIDPELGPKCNLSVTEQHDFNKVQNESITKFTKFVTLNSTQDLLSRNNCEALRASSITLDPSPSINPYLIVGIVIVSLATIVSTCCCVVVIYVKIKYRRSFINMLLISLGKKPDDLKTRNYYANAPDLRYSGRRVDWDSWEVDIQTLSVNKTNKLGAGAFADVFRGEIRELDLPESTVSNLNIRMESTENGFLRVAVKMLHKPETEQSRQAILKEIDIMKSIGYHIHLVSLIGCITNVQSSSPFFIMELCSKGSLLDLLHVGKSDGGMENNTQSERNSTMAPMELDTIGETKIVTDDNAPILSLKMLASFAWQISNGLNFLTSKGIIHCDVAARNVLVTREMVAKLGDFGLCQRVNILDKSDQKIDPKSENISEISNEKMDKIPIKWTAPEALERAEFSVKSDVWSYGILLHEIYSFGEVPYALIQPEDMLYHLQHGQRLAQQQDCPDEIYDLMQQCWQIEPELRPTFEEVRTKIENVLGLLSDMYGYLSVNQAEYFTTSAVQLNDNRDTDESSAMHISP